ncbi:MULTISPECIES: ABC transporter ATP-binding protein [Bradyrhizobium]|uniref:ABC transporter ATP-binding protein n=1 Tax=Bradyrhizobium zhengyangense TaxID=2911009 RepID=A0A9X1RD56_9BRAD|nr:MULTISPECIES: ABC transporter ATP-binding protein [Bradyrhizobium]MCG2629352.1 ABC transporter ATP-binding protein [Bradyrhizobium zhengyangense]MCG2644633.1 ABC transporter ATP-binding protein [Bradyrhizobium zhengyangense]MCG2670866.1 ABC transporter ATP-binding protein [Bradyrhizobium zhengyangense]MDN4984499.1 ABC transporter ATP-binding protein [Bradyrhizobium sp. WYCCWR 13022]MDN5002491.1 ABC transporter ATP-binding protein [Bradyrhizobium sp. WYCCWR 12677]
MPTARSEDAAPSATGIDVRDVSKIFALGASEQTVALKPLSLTIRKGEFFSFIGPSGCGKTTLLRIIAGLTTPTTGGVFINGTQVTGPDSRIGMVFQKSTLLPWRTVLQNLLLPVEVTKSCSMQEARSRADRLLEMMGIAAFKNRSPDELSGGMQQRAAIARALITDPEILAMDEPFSALDEFTRERLNDELMGLQKSAQKTIIFVTHNISEAVFLSDRIGVMAPRPGRLDSIIEAQGFPAVRDASLRKKQEFFREVARARDAFDRLHL